MKSNKVAYVTVFLLLAVTSPVAAQWMGGGMGQSNWWGGGMCRMMDVSPQPVDPANLPEQNSLGAQILKNQCTQCHGLVSPSQHATQDWPMIVDRMDRRMQMMAERHMGMIRHSIEPMTSAEKQALLNYLSEYSFQAANHEMLSGEQGPAVDTYVNVCSRCHALPNPAAHTAEEWAGVIERMEKNMMNLGMEPMTTGQKREIVTYLQDQADNS